LALNLLQQGHSSLLHDDWRNYTRSLFTALQECGAKTSEVLQSLRTLCFFNDGDFFWSQVVELVHQLVNLTLPLR